MKLNHVSSVKTPSINMAKGPENQAIFKQLMRLLYDNFVNIFKDLENLDPGTVAALPTASKDLVGKFHLVTQGSAADKLYICVYNTNSTSYEWKEIAYV